MNTPTKKELEILIRVRNEASKEMKRAGDDAADVGKKAKKATKEGSDGMDRFSAAAKRVGAALKSLINPLTLISGAVGVGAIIGVAKSLSEAADAADGVRAKFDIVFGTEAERYRARMEALATEMGRGRIAMQGLAADAQPVIEQLLGSRDAALSVTDALVRLAVDASEMTGIADSDIWSKFEATLNGSAEALRGMAAAIKPAEVDAKALALGFAASTEELTEQDRVVARLNLLFERLSFVQGEADRGAKRFGSRMRELKGVVQDLQVEFGSRLNQAILEGLDAAGGAKLVADLTKLFFGSVTEFSRVAVTAAAEIARAAGKALEEFGGADGVIAWLQDRGNALVAELRVFGAEFAVMAARFAGSVQELLRDLTPTLRALNLVGTPTDRSALEREREALRELEAKGKQYVPGGQGGIFTNRTLRVDVRLREIDEEIARIERLAELDAARVAARDQLTAAQARLNATTAAAPDDPWASADFTGLGAAIASATGAQAPGATETAVAQALDVANEIARSNGALAASETAVANAIDGRRDATVRLNYVLERQREAQQAAERFSERQTAQLADAFLGVATGATKAKDAVKQFLQAFIQDLLRLQTIQAFSALFGGAFSGIFGAVNSPSIAGTGTIQGPANPFGSVDGGLAPGVSGPQFASALAPAGQRYGRGFAGSRPGGASLGGSVAVALTINAVDSKSVVDLLAREDQGFGALLTRAITSNRDVNAIVRGQQL